MSQSSLETAQGLLKRRDFAKAIRLLEQVEDKYYGVFEYYMALGLACLYVGDTGNANQYFQRARKIKMTDSNLLLGQAVLFLKRGDTDRAVQYYIEILDKDPLNKRAKSALEFIRYHGDFETICKWADSGRLEQFYPPIGFNPYKIIRILASIVVGVGLGFGILHFVSSGSVSTGKTIASDVNLSSERGDLSTLVLSGEEISELQLNVHNSYNDALQYFQDYRDNAAQVEINKIRLAGAADSVMKKVDYLEGLLENTKDLKDSTYSFDNLPDNYDVIEVSRNSVFYKNCYVSWAGRYTNDSVDSDGNLFCDYLVGYENMSKLDEVVRLKFDGVPNLDRERSLKILGRLEVLDDKLVLNVKSYYQPIKNQ